MESRPVPPELLAMIIECAAKCDSTHDSHKSRQATLSALSLVNRTFHEIAQPLLPQKVVCRNQEELFAISDAGVVDKVQSLTYGNPLGCPTFPGSMNRFANLTRLRAVRGDLDLGILGRLQHLARLAFEDCELSGWTHLVLPQLVELSLDMVDIDTSDGSSEGSSSFLSTSHLPSLRILAIRQMQIGARQYVPIEHSLALQLDCIVADQVYPVSRQVANVDRPILDDSLAYPVPFLLDLGFHESTSWWGTPSSSLDPTLSYAHVQIRVDVEGGRTTPRRSHVKMALELVEDLLAHSTALKELYLDFDGRPGRIGYDLHGKSEEAEEIRKIEDQAGKKNVEIIWESRQDDWCRSLGSKEFWRRCKKKREQKEGVEAR